MILAKNDVFWPFFHKNPIFLQIEVPLKVMSRGPYGGSKIGLFTKNDPKRKKPKNLTSYWNHESGKYRLSDVFDIFATFQT
jgi:hypothetical protein